ncbi:MAG: tripartite tricarboxylate transporter substrate binding protein [Brachymonas sp.]|nr:tripartite tricarboxylate transporter substrate binding protein [Brachymonas sp.]
MTWAQTIQLVVPFPASSPSSELARQLAMQMTTKLGQPVTVEYKPGGNSKVAQDYVRAAKPDGQTFLWATSAIVVEPVIAAAPQEVARDLMPLALSVRSSLIMVARTELPQRSFEQVLSYLRHGGKISCGYGGGAMLLACSALKQISPDAVTLVPYQSSGLAVPDLVGERLDVAFMLIEPSVKSLIAADKLRLLGRTHSTSSDPLIAQSPLLNTALPALAISPWQAWFAPKGTPPELAQRFVKAAQEVSNEPVMLKHFSDFDFRAEHLAEPEFSNYLNAEFQRYSQICVV